MTTKFDRATLVEAFHYLDRIRALGKHNMWGVSSLLARAIGSTQEDARALTGLWRDTFKSDVTVEDRVTAVLKGE